MSVASRLVAKLASLPPAQSHRVRVERDLRVPLADGTALLADRWMPTSSEQPPPILLTRTPYGRGGLTSLLGRLGAERGYQVVVVSCRGTFGSGGEWSPFRNEQADGAEVLGWLERQPWFVPHVVTIGASYFGLTQWAVAADPPPWLKAMSLGVTSSWFRDMIYPGNTFALETTLTWIYGLETQERPRRQMLRALAQREGALRRGYAASPLSASDVAAVGRQVGYFQDWLDHADPDDPWWAPIDFGQRLDSVPPTSHVAGWYDLFLPHQLEDVKRLRAEGRPTRLLVGPWKHASPAGLGALLRDLFDWCDVQLRGRTTQRASDVRLYVLGADRWIDVDTWPPPSTPHRHHLSAGGRLTAQVGHGGPDHYRYDPADPTPSVGGASLAASAGAKDNRKRESRADVLTYTTGVLAADVTVVGEVSVELYARSSSEHTDFVVRLCDVAPSGRSINISDGIVRVDPARTAPQPDGTLALQIAMTPTACTFRRGHRIRLQVASAAHPLYARNTGTGEPLGKATTMTAADQEILHDEAHPSALVLPLAQL